MPEARQPAATILVVDDEAPIRRLIRAFLERVGFTVLEAGNAAEALDTVNNGADVSLVLTDILMPGLSGPQLAAQIAEIRTDLPVVLMTGYAECVELPPGCRWLRKPFSSDELLAIVHHGLTARCR